MPRPDLDEDIMDEVRQIHRHEQGEPAGSFQEALDTVLQLASKSDNRKTSTEWYPGKYAKQIFDRLTEGEKKTPSASSFRDTADSALAQFDPASTAIFKAQLDDERQITLPKGEALALGINEGAILQVYAQQLSTE